LSVARGVQYAAIALGLGAAIFLLVAWLPALAETAGPGDRWAAASEAFARRLRALAIAAALIGALSAAVAVILQGAVASATSFWSAASYDTLREILGTRFGTVWGLAALAWLIVAGFVLARVASLPRLQPASVGAAGLAPRYSRWGALALIPLGFLAAVPALGGHASAQDPTWLLLPANVLHVLAMAAWLGGIAVLVFGLRAATAALEPSDRTRLLAATVVRFSALAGLAIAVVLATGVAQSIVHLDSFGNLLDTAFGRAILVKFTLFVVIVAIGWINRNRLLPPLRRAAEEGGSPARAGLLLRRTVRLELALGAAVIVATAALASYAPPGSAAGGPYSTDFDLGPARAELTVDPAEVGANEMHLYFFRRDDGSQWNATKELTITAALPEKEIPSIEFDPRKAGPGHYVVPRSPFGVAGDWRVEVVSRVSDFEEHRATVEVPIR
jgi:copper transport protein